MFFKKMYPGTFRELEGACFSLYWNRPPYRRLPGALCRPAAHQSSARKNPCIRNPFPSGSRFEPLRYQQSYLPPSSSCSGDRHRCFSWTKKAPGLCDHRKWRTLPRCCCPKGTAPCWRYSYHRNRKYCRDYGTAYSADHPAFYRDQSGR